MAEVARIIDRLIIDAHDYVAGAETGFVRPAAFLHGTNQDTLSVLYAEEFTQLGRDVFHHQSAAHGGVCPHHRHRHVELRHRGHGGHFKLEVFWLWTPRYRLVTIRKLHLQRHRLAVAAYAQRDDPASGSFANHAPQLRAALHVRAVHAEDDIMFSQSSLA